MLSCDSLAYPRHDSSGDPVGMQSARRKRRLHDINVAQAVAMDEQPQDNIDYPVNDGEDMVERTWKKDSTHGIVACEGVRFAVLCVPSPPQATACQSLIMHRLSWFRQESLTTNLVCAEVCQAETGHRAVSRIFDICQVAHASYGLL